MTVIMLKAWLDGMTIDEDGSDRAPSAVRRGAAAAGRRRGPTRRRAPIIYDAARHEFAVNGFAATSMETWRGAPAFRPRRCTG